MERPRMRVLGGDVGWKDVGQGRWTEMGRDVGWDFAQGRWRGMPETLEREMMDREALDGEVPQGDG